MNRIAILSLLLCFCLASAAHKAYAVTDPVVNIIDKGTEYINQVGQVQEDVNSQMNEYMNVKVGIPGDAKSLQKAADKAQRIKTKAEKYQAKAEKMQKKIEKAKEKAAAIKAEKDKLQAKANKIKAEYQKAQEKVNKAKEKIAEAKAKVDEVKGEIDKAKQQYEDVKGKVEEAKAGLNDIKEGASALKDAAQAKLDEARSKIPGQDEAAGEAESGSEEMLPDAEDNMPDETVSADTAVTGEPIAENAEGQAAVAVLRRMPVNKADTLSALNTVLQENSVQTAVTEAVAVPDTGVLPQMLTPREVMQKAEEVKLDTPEKAEHSSPLDIQEQLKMLDAAKARELSESTPKHISQKELRGQLKAGDDAKLEALRASRRDSTRKSFSQTQNNPKGEADVR